MVGTRRLTDLVGLAVDRLELPEGPLVVALSGGADSATLAFLCGHVGRPVRAVHVNHGLPHSGMMERAARSVAAATGLGLSITEVEVGGGPSPEGQARRARYSALAGSTGSGESVLTAHTADDTVETVVFNLARGTGPRGLSGIPHYRPPNVYRPLLAVTRSETREIAGLAGLPFIDDPMNQDPALTRNIIRSRIIPMLSELNPRLTESITRMATAIGADSRHLDQLAAQIPIQGGVESSAIAVGSLWAVPRPLADRGLKTMLGRLADGPEVSSERVDLIWDVVRGNVTRAELGGGVIARRVGPMLEIGLPPEVAAGREATLDPGVHRVGRIEYEVIAHESTCRAIPLSRWAAVFPRSTVLTVGSDGVVAADGEPAWIPGERRLPVAWYEPGSVGYLSVLAREKTGWTSSH